MKEKHVVVCTFVTLRLVSLKRQSRHQVGDLKRQKLKPCIVQLGTSTSTHTHSHSILDL